MFSWSGGKDSTLALLELLRSGEYEVAALLTTVTEGYDRISMHGVRRALLEQQADSLGLPLEKVYIPQNCSNEIYESRMREALLKYQSLGVSSVVSGDIFLEDLRQYRETKLAQLGLKGLFPIWKQDSVQLAKRFIDLGFKAIVVCVDNQHLDQLFAGCLFDMEFLSRLPPNVDPCGENGEFHTFVYDGPLFHHRINFEIGEIVLRENRFYYCDLTPSQPCVAEVKATSLGSLIDWTRLPLLLVWVFA